MRGLIVNPDLCFGCRACSSVCPARLIALRDEDGRRFLRFPGVCDEDCSRCQEVCPPGAITLGEVAGAPEAVELEFVLRRCTVCGRAFAPEKALAALRPRVREAVGGGELPWWDLCPSCRRGVLAGSVAQAASPLPVG
jgi:formate hydrogenlyase subunit 6/NADH:ubiquinone oxidoreductase subunit I